MNEVMSPLHDKLLETLEAAITAEALAPLKKKIKDALDEIEVDIDYTMKENLQSSLACYVQEMAEKAIDALLRGDAGQMAHYLSCAPGYYNGRNSSLCGSVINGKLSEYDPIKLRRQIVDAHADLLKNERILDLESQVAALVEQVSRVEADNARIIENYR